MSLDISKIEKFRDLINCSFIQSKIIKNCNWDKLCSAMDIIDVAVLYIERIHWDETPPRFAFQLMELITAGQMIKKGIYEILNIFRIDNPFQKERFIFKVKETDDKIFSEYRALTFAHNLDFNKNNYFANGSKTYFAWCYWENYDKKIANTMRYSKNKEDAIITIDYNEIYSYIKKRYDYLDEIINFLIKKYKKDEQ